MILLQELPSEEEAFDSMGLEQDQHIKIKQALKRSNLIIRLMELFFVEGAIVSMEISYTLNLGTLNKLDCLLKYFHFRNIHLKIV